jgi:hypothetical protein
MVVEDVLTTFTSAAADGLVAANERMTVMLRGEHPFVDAHGSTSHAASSTSLSRAPTSWSSRTR